ncbi:hypothetical protein G7Y89_g4637 [Cudoniella acicularis]|uniref:F-box domain-containing protein n=1 Tax=Cudoniella acicularis TaxID=354080 RepID=A0A8H4W443_9HELO|nr:hypothetical protein G7Y89_g4637 [Cudoniella acicularis]
MPSLVKKVWNTAFRSHRNSQTSDEAAGSPTSTPAHHSSKPAVQKDSYRTSYASSKVSRAVIYSSTSSPPCAFMPAPEHVTRRSIGQDISYLEDLPEHILDKIVSDLLISDRLCLRFTCKILWVYLTGRNETAEKLVGFEEFAKEPQIVRERRLSLLVRLEADAFQLFGDRKEKTSEEIKSKLETTRGIIRNNTYTCSTCAKLHDASAFEISQLDQPPSVRHCKGSTRILHLCCHATMTWDQFTTDIVNDFPYYRSTALAPTVLTRTYARNSELSPRDVVQRHFHGSHCQSWEGTHWQRDRPVPAGSVSFQYPFGGILWYSTWHIGIQHVWDAEERKVVTGENSLRTKVGPGIPTSTLASIQGKVTRHSDQLMALISRLNSFEIYICPHVTFSHPIMYDDCLKLVQNDFAPGVSNNPICPICQARINMYVQEKKEHMDVEELVIIIARHVGTGDSAMQKDWVDGTREGC